MAPDTPRQRRSFRGADVGLPAVRTVGWGRHLAARQALTAHEHGEAYEICYIADGRVEWWVENETHTVDAGQVYLTRPGETHGGVDDVMHPCELFWLVLALPKRGSLPGLTAAETAGLRARLQGLAQRRFDGSAAIAAAFRAMFDAFTDEPDQQRLAIRTALHQLLLELLRCHDRHAQRRAAVSAQVLRAMRWIDANASEDFNLDAVAAVARLGISQFHARFRREVGLTPARYRTRRRIEAAKRLLRETSRPVTDIAMTCGFATSQYFATVFRQQVGMNAGDYREKAARQARIPAPFADAHGAASDAVRGRTDETPAPAAFATAHGAASDGLVRDATPTGTPHGEPLPRGEPCGSGAGASASAAHGAAPRTPRDESLPGGESRGYPPTASMHWRHAVLHTRGAWLPGDGRGFRSRGHKIHSSGDYRNPPPRGEHAGLFAYSKMLRPHAVTIPADLRRVVGEAMIAELRKQRIELLALSVCAQHVHVQVKLPDDDAAQWDILGDCKRAASHAVRRRIPGGMWGRKGRIERITSRKHHAYLFRTYIPQHQREGAWVWDFRRGVVFDPAGG